MQKVIPSREVRENDILRVCSPSVTVEVETVWAEPHIDSISFRARDVSSPTQIWYNHSGAQPVTLVYRPWTRSQRAMLARIWECAYDVHSLCDPLVQLIDQQADLPEIERAIRRLHDAIDDYELGKPAELPEGVVHQ